MPFSVSRGMGVLLGGGCFSQSLYPLFLSSSQKRNASKRSKKKEVVPMASFHYDNPTDMNFLKRRTYLLVGLSSFPLLQSRARALEDPVSKDIRMREVDSPQNLEMLQGISSLQKNETEIVQAPGNPFVALLNGLGFFGIGILGALYALAQKEKAEIESTIESMKTQLREKEAGMAGLRKDFDRRLQNEQEERLKQISKSKQELASWSGQLASANTALTGVGKELQSEKKLVQELKMQTDRLQNGIEQADEDKKILEAKLREKHDTVDILQDKINLLSLEIRDKEASIENLSSSLTEKESECNNLISICEQTKANLAEATSAIAGLKEELLKTREELESKISLMAYLNIRISTLLTEREGLNKKVLSLQEEYDNLRSSSEKQAASYSKLLADKDNELNHLKDKLGVALNEASSNQALIANLTKERADLRIMLEKEINTVKNLRGDLQLTQETLEESRLEAADLSKQLKQTKMLCEELTSNVSRIQAEFSETQKSLSRNLDEAKSTSKAQSDELVSVREALTKTKQELAVVTDELKDVMEAHENLKKELLQIYKKAETAAQELGEERKVVDSLKKELEASSKQIVIEKEAWRSLETDLEDATKSLDVMNKNTLLLSRELEIANSRTASVESEKDMIYKSFIDQKDTAKEAKEDLEDAQNLLMKLGKERENLEKRSKRLEEELAATKGEILRLRRKMNLTRSSIDGSHEPMSREAAVGTPVSEKRSGRRRKSGPAPDAS